MAKVLFIISYDIKSDKKDEYLQLISKMKQHFQNIQGEDYNVYEQKGKKNFFSEVFTCKSLQEFDELEDNQDEMTQQFIAKLESMVEGKMCYQTLVELE